MHLVVFKSEGDFVADGADTSVDIVWVIAIIKDNA
jgi:hypothetical protein